MPLDNPADTPADTLEKPVRESQPAWKTLARLTPYLAPYRSRVILAGVSLLVAAASTLSIPVAFRLLIDNGFNLPDNTISAQTGGVIDNAASTEAAWIISSDAVNQLFLGIFLLAVLLAISTALRFYCVTWLGDRMTADLKSAVFRQVIRQDPVFFETLRSGEVQSRLSSDTTLIQSLIGSSISLGLRNSVLFVGAMLLMIWSSPGLSVIIIGLLLAVVAPILFVGRKVRKLSRESQDRLADSGALAGEILGAMQTVQSYVRERLESERYAEAADIAFRAALSRNRQRALLTAMAITLVFASIVFVLWLGANAVMSGRMSPGLLTQFMLYAAILGGSTGALAEVIGDVQRAAGATERLMELLDSKPAIRSGSQPMTMQQTAGASVTLQNVTFNYPSRPQQAALSNVSLQVEPGKTIALVGPSGAGKTTILQLLLRFYDPQEGRIFFNDQPINTLSLSELRSAIGLVSQESVVFSDNVANNIRYGYPEAGMDAVEKAAADAQASEFINRLPDGFQTFLGERGVRLSGGQRQRISIARALLKNPPLLLLDEATSALDAESESRVQLALEQAMQGRTTIVIAHRLATIKNADRIIVLDQGRVVETGSHQTLMSNGKLYAKLAAMQFGVSN